MVAKEKRKKERSKRNLYVVSNTTAALLPSAMRFIEENVRESNEPFFFLSFSSVICAARVEAVDRRVSDVKD